MSADRPGNAVGMYNSVPSSSGGMNSLPMRLYGISVSSSNTPLRPKVSHGYRNTQSSKGR
ncbi:hypothetical protein D3C71_2041260 [compost metagenome]